MAGEGYSVSTTELQAHVGSVQHVADTLGQAVDAAQQVTVGVQAYGLICGPLFVPIVMAVSAPGIIALTLAQQAIRTIAEEVGNTAAHYESVDQANSKSFTAVQAGLA